MYFKQSVINVLTLAFYNIETSKGIIDRFVPLILFNIIHHEVGKQLLSSFFFYEYKIIKDIVIF